MTSPGNVHSTARIRKFHGQPLRIKITAAFTFATNTCGEAIRASGWGTPRNSTLQIFRLVSIFLFHRSQVIVESSALRNRAQTVEQQLALIHPQENQPLGVIVSRLKFKTVKRILRGIWARRPSMN